MFKAVAMSLWLMALLSGSVYFFTSPPSDPRSADNAGPQVLTARFIEMDPITAAIVRESEVRGYIILELAFAVDEKAAEKVSQPLRFVLRDLVLGHIHADKELDIFKLEQYDIAGLGSRLTADINDKLGEEIVHEVLVQGVNFVSKDDVRDMLLRRS